MFRLTMINKDPVKESGIETDILNDDAIHASVESFFQRLSCDTKDEARLKDLLESSLMETLSIKFDYRNTNLGVEIERLSNFIKEQADSPLIFPLVQILEMYSKVPPSGIRERNLAEIEYLHESKVSQYAMALYCNGYIPDRFMESYIGSLTNSVYGTAYDIIGLPQGQNGVATESSTSISTDPACVQSSFPNSTILEAISESIQKEPFKSLVTSEELDCLIMDFLEDGELHELSGDRGSVYRILCKLVSTIYENLTDIDMLERLIELVSGFYEVFVKYPTELLLNTAILIDICVCAMMNWYKGEEQPEPLGMLQPWHITLSDDIERLRNLSVLVDRNTDEVYAELLAQWNNVSSCSVFDTRIGEMRRSIQQSTVDGNKVHNPWQQGDVGGMTSRMGSLQDPDFARDLMESFQVLQDGTIKVTVEKKSTYMDEYASNHRLLMANRKAGNWKAVGYNIVYHLILIENIEKNVLHNKKVKEGSELYEDAVKARSFAKNDVSTYLPELRRHLKNFDINEFYKQVKADQATISINGVETVSGVKKIVKSILL